MGQDQEHGLVFEAVHVLLRVRVDALQRLEQLVVQTLQEGEDVAPHLLRVLPLRRLGWRSRGAGLVILIIPIGVRVVLWVHDDVRVVLEQLQQLQQRAHRLAPYCHRKVCGHRGRNVEVGGDEVHHHLHLLRCRLGHRGEVLQSLHLLLLVNALFASRHADFTHLLVHHLPGDLLRRNVELALFLLVSPVPELLKLGLLCALLGLFIILRLLRLILRRRIIVRVFCLLCSLLFVLLGLDVLRLGVRVNLHLRILRVRAHRLDLRLNLAVVLLQLLLHDVQRLGVGG
mmetsp:Transcript_25796/g.48951  ORF Transcript_25796/g.48951 Transcript_25796/m.48951 type:complete len:286 (-) Transcript_25796:515-1372(-)